jgi:hypothetical protein
MIPAIGVPGPSARFSVLAGRASSAEWHTGDDLAWSRGTAIRTSASRQTGTGSVFSGWATQILQGQLWHPAKPLHLGGKPRYNEEPRTEEQRAVEVDKARYTKLPFAHTPPR